MWHLDFREGILVHDLVFLDHLTFPEEKRGDGVYLVGSQRTFLVEMHTTVDEVPHPLSKELGKDAENPFRTVEQQ
jgi:hypothetical protein